MNYKELLMFVGRCSDFDDLSKFHCPYAEISGYDEISGCSLDWCWDCLGCRMEDMCLTALEMGWA